MSRSNTLLPASRARMRLCLGSLLLLGVAFGLLVFSPGPVDAAEPLALNAVWTLETPLEDEWVSLPATISVTVVDPDGAWPNSSSYRYSTNEGATWSDWIINDDSIEYHSTVTTTVRMTATIAALINSETQNQVEFRVTDRDGWTEELSGPYTIKVDAVPPGAPSGLAADPAGWTSTNSFDLSWTNPADTTGIAWAHYKVDAPPSGPNDADGSQEGEGITSLNNISVGSTGQHTIYVWLEDGAGNSGHGQTASVQVYYSGSSAPGAPIGLQIQPSGWTGTNDFTATWSNPFTVSGIQAAWYRWDSIPIHSEHGTRVAGEDIESLPGLTVSGDGQHTLYVWLENGAGLKSHLNRRSASARYDTTPPNTSYTFTPALPPSGWFNQSVTVNLNATDAGSGVDQTRWRREGGLWNNGSSFVATESQTYEFYSVDNVGNQEDTKTLSVQIDATPPVSAWRLDPPEPAGGWYSETVTIHLTATDEAEGSGWSGYMRYKLDGGSWQLGSQVAVTADGVHRIEFNAQDVAGNNESPQTVDPVCRIDRTPPVVSATPDKVGEFLQPPVTINLGAVDALNGVARIEYRLQGDLTWTQGTAIVIDGSGGDGYYAYEYRAIDTIGNLSPTESIAVKIDGTPPTPPSGLASDPSAWTKVNGQFGLTWANPVDYSGIAGVYYQIDQDPTVTLSPAFVPGDDIQALSNLAMPNEGEHTIYIWLQDHAGNASEFANQSLASAFKYDVTAPVLDPAQIDGTMGDDGQHYRGPVQITLSGTDGLSGITSFSYKVDAGAWLSPTVQGGNPYVFVFDQQSRHTIYYRTTDQAGNTSPTREETVRIDSVAPSAPTNLTATPSGWTNLNNFQVCWTGPGDVSGVGAVYYKIGEPPTSHTDGTPQLLPGGESCVSGLTLDQQGEVPVYLWLQDKAGNVDSGTARAISLRLDTVAPVTDLDPTGTMGDNDYYITPVSVCFAANDGPVGTVSGVSRIYYKIDDGPEIEWDGEDVVFGEEGEFEVEFWSWDLAGNEERPHRLYILKIDLYAPSAKLWAPSDYAPTTSVPVAWQGTDSSSGIARYRVQYRTGSCTNWQDWLASTANTQGTFPAPSPGHFYQFRVQATDRAGRLSAWSELGPTTHTYVEGLANADFELGWLGAWDGDGSLDHKVVNGLGPHGTYTDMAQVGNEAPCRAELPADSYGSVSQQVTLPNLQCEAGLILSYRYLIQTFDVAWGKVGDFDYGWIDPFIVYIRDVNRTELARFVPGGNRTDYNEWFECDEPGSFYTSTWRVDTIDLTPWAGQTIRIDFRQLNGLDPYWPSWTLIDDVKLMPKAGRVVYLPLVLRQSGPGAASLPETQGAGPSTELPAVRTRSGRPSRR